MDCRESTVYFPAYSLLRQVIRAVGLFAVLFLAVMNLLEGGIFIYKLRLSISTRMYKHFCCYRSTIFPEILIMILFFLFQ